jgi:hypothetical protein
MWTVASSVGKLVEARLMTADSYAVAACLGAIAETVASAPCPVVGLLDMTQVRVLAQEEAQLLLSVMREDNARVQRTAIVINADPLFGMQVERLVRAAGLPQRQVFRVPAQAVGWLAEVLSPEETARARAFMAE